MATNFHLAPPPKMVDGLLAVPIDIQTIDGTFVFDAGSQTATADVTISYTVGPTAGNPIFDLRQAITQAWLDAAPFGVGSLGLHDFGAGAFAGLRIIESVQAAGSMHTLRVQYTLGAPQSETGGYTPKLDWLPGPKLRFALGLSDLRAGRYAEAWLPANLIFDQFSLKLTVQITNTLAAHSVITNGTATSLGVNHWEIQFPGRFTALSPMLEIHATDALEWLTDTVLLPVSGNVVTIEAWKPAGTSTNLPTQINNIKGFLTDNENNYGAYVHGNRFVAFFNGSGGMEYEGGTTTSTGALQHETFHSWFARGVKPSGQADGWWDEAYTQYHDAGAAAAVPFSFIGGGTVLLCSRNPWQRKTPGNSYTDGQAFFEGLASLLGVSNLNSLMAQFYQTYRGAPLSTQMFEEFLICKSGNATIVDAFHRFVYGYGDPSPAPDLWMKDDPAHTGADLWGGTFWDSPDLWIRNADDNVTTHQPPEFGQDNWFYARVRNKGGSGASRHFVVTFHKKEWAGTEFVYPNDFLPCVAAKAEFELNPGEVRVVKARWPRSSVPPAGTHPCLLASVITRGDHPTAGLHVWEHNSLAQKNLTVVDLLPNWFIILPVLIRSLRNDGLWRYDLEIWRDDQLRAYPVSLVHRAREFFEINKPPNGFRLSKLQTRMEGKPFQPDASLLDCGGHLRENSLKPGFLTPDRADLIAARFPNAYEARAGGEKKARFPVNLPFMSQTELGLKVTVPPNAKRGSVIRTHLVQRNAKTKQITGGVALEIRVV